MDKRFIPAEHEAKLYAQWEQSGIMRADNSSKKSPYCIVLPPPNANADLHLGHTLYVYEDIMIRYHKMNGAETLWVPGADHAGFETQFVFEKHLAKQDKSRFDYDRETLYKMIWDFVHKNRSIMENQLRRLGFFLDWSRSKFTLDPDIVKIVYGTFKKMFDEGLVYRSERLVNFCTRDGTSFSDLEVVDKEVDGLLYHIKFPLKKGGFITVATTRPETMLGDVAVMVNAKDKRYKDHIGETVILPLTLREIPVIADEYVDMKFGTGAVKVTPAHDFNDYEIARRHNLSYPSVIGFNGRMQNTGTDIDGMKVKIAREEVLKRLRELNLLEKEAPHKMVLKTCYKCGTTLEPLPLPQWYINVRPLADRAISAIKDKEVTFTKKRYEKVALQWLTNFHDWNISRQTVWGMQIPAYQCQKNTTWFVSVEKPETCQLCEGCEFKQDTDTFDTWFSSSQWPFVTLMTTEKGDFEKFYPTSVMETGYEILPWWVCRMLMVGLYVTGKVPFKKIFLHGMLRDNKGQKMSKSKGNVINPLLMVDKYGADALRAAFVFNTQEGSDTTLSEEKIIGMRNFANKVWNIGRFIDMNQMVDENGKKDTENEKLKELDVEFTKLSKKYHTQMKACQFSAALGELYEFIWHRFADYYIEQLKDDLKNGTIEVRVQLERVYLESVRMLHPFMPFVTEAVYKEFKGEIESIIRL